MKSKPRQRVSIKTKMLNGWQIYYAVILGPSGIIHQQQRESATSPQGRLLVEPLLLKRVGGSSQETQQTKRTGSPILKNIIGAKALLEREQEIGGFLTAGLTDNEIASTLSISSDTLKYHLKSICRKMRVEIQRDLLKI